MITTESYPLLIVVWTAWCGLHSVLICVPVTNYFERLVGTEQFFSVNLDNSRYHLSVFSCGYHA